MDLTGEYEDWLSVHMCSNVHNITYRIAGNSLEPYKPQRMDETYQSVMAKNCMDWRISSQGSNRARFRDYPVVGVGCKRSRSGRYPIIRIMI